MEKPGVLKESRQHVIPLEDIFYKINKCAPKTVAEFIKMSNDYLIQEIENAISVFEFEGIKMEDVRLCAPIPNPFRNIICLGKNYIDHAIEAAGMSGAGDGIPTFPIYFTKSANPAIGDGEIIKRYPELTDELDYEVELAVVIGKDGRDIKREEAENHVFGYTIVNDISARDIQRKHEQWFRGKSLDTFCPMGPYLVHKSKIPFPVELNIKCRVNGEVRQDSNTKNLIFDIPHIISDISKGMLLKAGDIIITGTPAGVALGLGSDKYLTSGDKVECYVERIGTLLNTIE